MKLSLLILLILWLIIDSVDQKGLFIDDDKQEDVVHCHENIFD